MLAHIYFVAASGMCPKETSLRGRILLVSPLQNHQHGPSRAGTLQENRNLRRSHPFPEFAEAFILSQHFHTNTDSPAMVSWKALIASASSNKLPIAGAEPFMVSLWMEILEIDVVSALKLPSPERMSHFSANPI